MAHRSNALSDTPAMASSTSMVSASPRRLVAARCRVRIVTSPLHGSNRRRQPARCAHLCQAGPRNLLTPGDLPATTNVTPPTTDSEAAYSTTHGSISGPREATPAPGSTTPENYESCSASSKPCPYTPSNATKARMNGPTHPGGIVKVEVQAKPHTVQLELHVCYSPG